MLSHVNVVRLVISFMLGITFLLNASSSCSAENWVYIETHENQTGKSVFYYDADSAWWDGDCGGVNTKEEYAHLEHTGIFDKHTNIYTLNFRDLTEDGVYRKLLKVVQYNEQGNIFAQASYSEEWRYRQRFFENQETWGYKVAKIVYDLKSK